jgi:hypothetical protein
MPRQKASVERRAPRGFLEFAMSRTALVMFALATFVLTPGCIVVQTADLAVGATGAVVGTAGKVVVGTVDAVTPGKTAPEDKFVTELCEETPA